MSVASGPKLEYRISARRIDSHGSEAIDLVYHRLMHIPNRWNHQIDKNMLLNRRLHRTIRLRQIVELNTS